MGQTQSYHPSLASSVPLTRASTRRGNFRQVGAVSHNSQLTSQMLWIDSVGGFLLCFDSEIVIGQPGSGANLPILADLSRRHAVLRREAEGHVLEPLGPVKVAGHAIAGPMLLPTECVIELGSAVRMRFRRPHALSSTARLTIESGHRTTPAADAVLLVGESCVLGPQPHSHVVCRAWPGEVVLFRNGPELRMRTNVPVCLAGIPVQGSTPLTPGARLEGENLGLTLEEIG